MDDQLATRIDELLDVCNDGDLLGMLAERRRKKVHDKAKATQPKLGIDFAEEQWKVLQTFMTRSFEQDEAGQGGLDHLTVTVKDCLKARDADDLLFALIRAWRKCHALQPHLGAIES